jgi:hypothetical protein
VNEHAVYRVFNTKPINVQIAASKEYPSRASAAAGAPPGRSRNGATAEPRRRATQVNAARGRSRQVPGARSAKVGGVRRSRPPGGLVPAALPPRNRKSPPAIAAGEEGGNRGVAPTGLAKCRLMSGCNGPEAAQSRHSQARSKIVLDSTLSAFHARFLIA